MCISCGRRICRVFALPDLCDCVLISVPLPQSMCGVLNVQDTHSKAGLSEPRPDRSLQVQRGQPLPVTPQHKVET